ncbi:DUF29 domain-containing protein [Aurantimonas sp. VKM B-3413]|uniref:DUF29 domain-containing protein n=1 Tax=Aurantimonas sp. VKM B-3413 TaxID=2779401 RepID=UPI001E302932|nr:DUF29 domain-containing protein [Aurantimonas sp. VKM B-3413]MCB8838431.1 DUF29 domain-containing protein [Aurantimonas sp. VKM B-3413]
MSNAPKIEPADDLYGRDGHAWAEREAALLRERRFNDIDLENIIEEIETVGRSEWRSIVSNYRLIAMHLLKWQFQPERRTRSWSNTIQRERRSLKLNESKNPSLAAHPQEQIQPAYEAARGDAADETGLPPSIFPEACPYTVEQLRDPDFLPE